MSPAVYYSQRLTTFLAPHFVKKPSAETATHPALFVPSPDPATSTHVSGHTQESFSLVTTNLCSATQSCLGFPQTEESVCLVKITGFMATALLWPVCEADCLIIMDNTNAKTIKMKYSHRCFSFQDFLPSYHDVTKHKCKIKKLKTTVCPVAVMPGYCLIDYYVNV